MVRSIYRFIETINCVLFGGEHTNQKHNVSNFKILAQLCVGLIICYIMIQSEIYLIRKSTVVLDLFVTFILEKIYSISNEIIYYQLYYEGLFTANVIVRRLIDFLIIIHVLIAFCWFLNDDILAKCSRLKEKQYLNTSNKPTVMILSGLSGVGKDTIVKQLIRSNDSYVKIKTYTTREKRNDSNDNYYYISEDEFKRMIDKKMFIEHNYYSHHFYGTSKESIEQAIKTGKLPILVIDKNGCKQIQKEKQYHVVSFFILPPSAEELYERLTFRGTESKEEILQRMKVACKELKKLDLYNYFVINESVMKSVDEINQILEGKNSNSHHSSFFLRKLRKELMILIELLEDQYF